ncbi:MAG: 6-phosphogluconolactonase [Alphaproteobacteria bacterium]|nr:6-phosphogluconolactonase [Alphaproteobacteria bacterium]
MSSAVADLARAVGAALSSALSDRGRALLAVSGGATPALYLPALSALDLPWSRIMVTLADERAVAADDAQSNIALVRRTLLRDRAADAATVFPDASLGLEGARADWAARLAQGPWPIDALICGIGADAHIASLFPGSAALSDPDPYVVIEPGGGERLARWSLSPAAIRAARFAALAFAGADKRAAWARAQAAPISDAPARLLAERGDVHVFDLT